MVKFNNFFKILIIIIGFIFLLSTIIVVGYNNFSQYKETIILQQQEHLLTIAKSISRSIDEIINNNIRSMNRLAKSTHIIEGLELEGSGERYEEYNIILEDLLKSYNDEISMVSLFDMEGKLVSCSGDKFRNYVNIDLNVIDRVFKSKEGFVSKEYLSGNNEYSIDIVDPVFNDDTEVIGILVNTMNLNLLYKDLIQPIQPGEKGYAMIKNLEGYIIMHSVTDQIGIESIKVRKELFPQYDWTDLEELHKKQVKEGEGYHIYNSRWWQEESEGLTEKINGYTTIEIGDINWIISVQMDYAEIEGPIKGSVSNMIIIGILIIIILASGFYIILKVEKRRKELEIETIYLKKLNQAWDELIKSEARLRHSQKLETIGTLVNGISHELNNLLSPILGYSEILLESVDCKSGLYEDILEINKSALRLKEIIGQILSFSRGDSNIAKFQYLEVGDVLKESIKLIQSIIPYNFQIVEDTNINKMILGNPTQLQQVLINLYTNSYHSMKDKNKILNVSAKDISINEKESKELDLIIGQYIRIRVEDNGIGMDSETLNQIFEYYFTTKEPGVGTGLGLPVVRGIIENHEGRIVIKSQLSMGTIVDIYLPSID